jgi:hypothetical protein
MKAPLILLTASIAYPFIAGMTRGDVGDTGLTLIGLGMIGGIIWAWVVEIWK